MRLKTVTSIEASSAALRLTDPAWISRALEDPAIAAEWPGVVAEIGKFAIATSAGGVNAGDRRALYHIVRALEPMRVLEVGTHIGASTLHIAAALRAGPYEGAELTTVDVVPVNDPATRPWETHGSTLAPDVMVAQAGMKSRVHFVTGQSLSFLEDKGPLFDLIFLDGDHSAATVYRELAAALARLQKGGVVLLHDYFVGGLPLWADGVVIPGPWLATERHRREHGRIVVLPLGALPWPTKAGSTVTSLALVSRVDS